MERNTNGPGSLRELLRVAVPLILSSGSISLMYVVDRMFLTWYSTDALAACLPAGLMFWVLLSLPFGTASYLNAFVAQYEGARRRQRVAAAIWQGIYFALASGLLIWTAAPLASKIFALIGHPPAVRQLEVQYFQILCFCGVPNLLATALSCFYSGRGKTMTVLWVNVTGTLTNIVLDYILIFGSFGAPALGIRGAAIATVFSSVVIAAIYVVLVCRSASSRTYGFAQSRRFDAELFGRLLRFGLPNGVTMLLDMIGFAAFVLLVGRLGQSNLAASNLAFNLNSMAFVPMVGLGTAVMTLVGQRIGEGRPDLAARTTWSAFALCSAYMGLFAAVYLFAPNIILRPYAAYTSVEEFAALRDRVTLLLRFVAVYSFFDGMALVFSAAVRGAGDTRWSLCFSTLAAWLLMVLPTYVALTYFTGSIWIAWTSVTVFVTVLGLGFLARFLGGKWRSMQIIEHADDGANSIDPDFGGEHAAVEVSG